MRKIFFACIIFLGGFFIISVPSGAENPMDSTVYAVKEKLEQSKKIPNRIIAQVGEKTITNHDVSKYQIYNSISGEHLSEDEVLDRLVKEELYLQLAYEKGVAASLEEGRKMAHTNRQILYSQDPKTIEIHHKLLDLMGITEDDYWNELSPVEYQKFISMENLMNLLLEEGLLKQDPQDPNSIGREILRFQQELYEKQVESKVIYYSN